MWGINVSVPFRGSISSNNYKFFFDSFVDTFPSPSGDLSLLKKHFNFMKGKRNEFPSPSGDLSLLIYISTKQPEILSFIVSVPFRGSISSNDFYFWIKKAKVVSVPFRGSISSNCMKTVRDVQEEMFPSPSGDLSLLMHTGKMEGYMQHGFRPLQGIYLF